MQDVMNVQSTSVIAVQPSNGWASLGLSELWQYRELLGFLAWRDVMIRYKQTVLGVTWAILQPLLTMMIFSLFLGKLAKVPSDGMPYPLFAFSALIPWTFFANGLTMSAGSLVSSSDMIKKVYFPRLAVPIASVLACLVDFCIGFFLLLGMMAFYGKSPTANAVWIPAFLLLAIVTCLGAGLWLSALNVLYRDVRYAVPFLLQFWLFASPVVYASSLLEEPWRSLYGINPMAGVVEGFRWALVGVGNPPGPIVIVSSVAAIALLASGLVYFRRMERHFADVA